MDILIIFWRSNSKYTINRDGGFVSAGNYPCTIKNKTGFNAYSMICTPSSILVFRHEFAHTLLGGNNFHSGGQGAGNGTFLSPMSGYGMLSSYHRNLYTYNGWERWRLGWKNATNSYYISARKSNNTEINADLVYGQTLNSEEFILRDFSTYGDAIRIKLPYLKSLNSSAKEQYIWIENHQLYADKIEYENGKSKGIRVNVQIGNDDLASFINSSTNYISPYSSFGNYDFTYTTTEPVIMTTSNQQANPLSGYHLSQFHAINCIDPNGTTYDKIYSKEYVIPQTLIYNGSQLLDNYPIFGNQYDIFPVGSSINISSNPSNATVLTYQSPDRGSSSTSPYLTPNTMDSRYIYLNGLSIEVLEQKSNGDIRVRIKWDQFDVDKDVRWCGPIVLNEKVNLKSDKTITLDQGLTPTKPLNPIVFNGTKVFADPTAFYCKNNSYFKLETRSLLDVKNNSAFVMESGSTLEINNDAKMVVRTGSTLQIKNGANLKVLDSGRIEVENGGYICIESGANIQLQHFSSVINLRPGYRIGVNIASISNQGTCISNLANAVFTGNGSINSQFSQDTYIQNETITASRYVTGKNIYIGRNVTSSKAQGDVIINNNATVILDAVENVIFDTGFEVSPGGTFETIIE